MGNFQGARCVDVETARLVAAAWKAANVLIDTTENQRTSERARILLVDDTPANLLALEATLEPLGQELVRARSGEEALKLIAEQEFAVVLLDVRMPGMDGFETATRIRRREKGRSVPIIFVTAEEAYGEEYAHRAYSQGAIDFLVKPFKPATVLSKVRVLVDLYLSRETIRRQQTEIIQAERDAIERQSETRLLTIIDLMPLCVIALHADGIPYFCNRAWREYTGIELDQASPQLLFEAIHPDERPRTREILQGALEGARPVELECRLRNHGDGSFRWHIARALPELGSAGTVIGWIATATDVERQKTAERQAIAANRMKDEFLAVVSHDLRTPLTSILGWASILASGNADESKMRRGLDTIQRNARAQARLIEDILDVARMISGKMRLDLTTVDVNAVVRAVVDAMQPQAEAKELTLSAELDAVPRTLADPERLQQVIGNLVANALKFTPKGGRVDLRVRAHDAIEIEVSDNGRGIDPQFLPHVFDRLRQHDARPAHGGLGLGLSIVNHLVTPHGGTVTAESPGLGQGARFTVRLAIRSRATAEEPAESAAPVVDRISSPASQRLRGVRVLVVDDDADSREFLKQVLGPAGADVSVASSSREALQLFEDSTPNVVLSDIELPEMDGYFLIRTIRDRPPERGGDVPAAALTAYARPTDAAAALDAGFDLHVAKPIEPFEVVDVVHDLAHMRR